MTPAERGILEGRLLIVLAAVMWSTSGFFVKAPWFDAWPEDVRGSLLAFWRSFFALFILIPLVRRPVWRWQLLPMAACFSVMIWSFMVAMVHGPAANAIWLQYLCPAWVLAGGVLLLNEKVTRSDLQMLGFCLSGVLLILWMEMTGGRNLYATAMGILSGLMFAGVVLCVRSMRDVDAAWQMVLNHGATVLLLSPCAWQTPERVSSTAYIALAFFGVFQISLPYLFFAKGLRSTSSPEASVLTLIEPILVPLWVYLAWHHHASYEAPRWWTWAGAGLITTGLLVRYIPPIVQAARRRGRMKSSVA